MSIIKAYNKYTHIYIYIYIFPCGYWGKLRLPSSYCNYAGCKRQPKSSEEWVIWGRHIGPYLKRNSSTKKYGTQTTKEQPSNNPNNPQPRKCERCEKLTASRHQGCPTSVTMKWDARWTNGGIIWQYEKKGWKQERMEELDAMDLPIGRTPREWKAINIE